MDVNDIISIYIETHGTDKVSNKKYHKYLKAIRNSIQWERTPDEIRLGDRLTKVQTYPDLYWHLHLHALRKIIIQAILSKCL